MKEHKPIRRDKAFVSFSRDHHFGLLLVWKIRNDLKGNMDAKPISEYVLTFFDDNLNQHFKDEESLLFSKLPADDVLRKQAKTEHNKIYLLIESLRENNEDKELLKEFADLLEVHIRFEERVLFNHLQEKMDTDELEAIFISINKDDHVSNSMKLFAHT
ncbi:hemerythrin domain-containing protein [Panacibacter ginsenosidivorans]|uniref:Hemerythrin domain-containing protein n=1 Tax=Panacibacter ginsenosidivorans TaxID=1813871 RepID=A0A5B8VDS2_9BACT|nr:hemerythrin domain-containing protein [Panacibacter ginsenosidivorans]QEC69205.1 hemerythrin domain-containing protein [Panacibacter ginsenosidivorans]